MNDIQDLFDKAQVYLRSAAVLLELEDFASCASRAYFAMFYAAQAALLADGEKVPGRQSLRAAFQKRFVDGGQVPALAGESFERAGDLQERADYSTAPLAQVDVEDCLQHAEAFVNSLERQVQETSA